MKLLFAAALLLAPTLPAQTAPEPPPPPIKTHEVNPDHTITFRYRSAGASSVLLQMDGYPKPVPLTRGPDGIWSFTTRPLPPELYAYRLDADGVEGFDPGNLHTTPNLVWPGALVEVPAETPQPWDETTVPHGEIHSHLYTSKVILGLPKDQESYLVYTPPGYDPRARKLYPVLYLLHGWSQPATGWTQTLQANYILDNLLAQGKIKPMVVVMPQGYGDMSFLSNYSAVWRDPVQIDRNTNLFSQALLNEILPRVEATYRVATDRNNRAIAGLSMGGLESLSIGLSNTGKFAYVGGFSAAVHALPYPRPIPALKPGSANLKLLWIACGVDDGLLQPNRKLAAELKTEGLPVTEIETSGAHVSYVWRDNLIHFAPLLFQSN